MLSGISTSFPVLSLSMRQVAHALLTRPPLIRPRRDFTVRLECVMHAASVHPEPGSNSLKIVYQSRFPLSVINSLEQILYAQLLKRAAYQISFINSKEFSESFFQYSYCCSIFNERSFYQFLSPLVDSLYIISHSISFVKWFFKSFLKTFFRSARLKFQRPFHYITSGCVCQVVFEIFFRIPSAACLPVRLLSSLVDSSVIISYLNTYCQLLFLTFSFFVGCVHLL